MTGTWRDHERRVAWIRAAVRSLTNGPEASDKPFLLPPCLWGYARCIVGTDLVLVYRIHQPSTIRVFGVADALRTH
jgi:hypothetical protein